MNLDARCKTTAMGIMPHTNIAEAIELALSLDIPFWPQLPNMSFYQDMYAQASQNFPGIVADAEDEKLSFNTARFEQELQDYSRNMGCTEIFNLTDEYSVVYNKFLEKELKHYDAIRGQTIGPISLGYNVLDENRKPIIYNDEVRILLFDFIQKKVNIQYHKLRGKNQNAFVWLDEPGLNYVFSGLFAYNDLQAKEDYENLLQGMEGPKALHLCPNVNLPYLLQLGVDLLSFDAFQLEFMPKEYATAAAEFLQSGGIISWGVVPTEATVLANQTPETLAKLLIDYWEAISRYSDLHLKQIAEQALIAPARCCVRQTGQSKKPEDTKRKKGLASQTISIEEMNINKAFAYLKEISAILKARYNVG